MQAQKQLEALKKARDEAMKDVKERKQIERDKWDREKQKHKNELSDINGKIDIAKTNRDDIQAQAKHAKQELEQAKQGLLPFQKNAKSILDDATFWNKQSKRNLSEHDRKRVKDAVNSNDKSINLNLNGLNQNDMQL
jgi:chromosome segregation ATPase